MQKRIIKQIYIPYYDWEDFQNGMWRSVSKEQENEMIDIAIAFTGNHVLYGAAMLKVIFAWKKTMINSLTNTSINQKAFVGHCAVCFELGIPEYITRIAWAKLTEQQRIDANKQAAFAIKRWKENYEKENLRLYSHLGTQMLFEWNS